MEHNQRKRHKGRRVSPSLLQRIKPNAAGIDCGSAEHYVAVPPDRDEQPVRRFKTFTSDLHRLADWLSICGVTTVAMEATGVYWIQTALGAFYRRLAYRIGKAKAVTATARKLAILVYRCLKGELVYKDPGAAAYDARHKTSVLRRLRQRAEGLGYSLLNKQTGELLEGGVS